MFWHGPIHGQFPAPCVRGSVVVEPTPLIFRRLLPLVPFLLVSLRPTHAQQPSSTFTEALQDLRVRSVGPSCHGRLRKTTDKAGLAALLRRPARHCREINPVSPSGS